MDYLDRSRARGSLLFIMHITSEHTVDFTRSVSIIVKQKVSDAFDYEIPNGKYVAMGYDVESDGLVQPEVLLYPAWREDLVITGSSQGILTKFFVTILTSLMNNIMNPS